MKKLLAARLKNLPNVSQKAPASSTGAITTTQSSTPDGKCSEHFPDGIKVLHDCPNAIVDICFVHGLTGNRDSTWTAEGHLQPWPQTLLPSRLSRSRILTYGYDAYIARRPGIGASSNKLIDHASNLLNDLTTDRAGCHATLRPIIFIAHSLGGLVCKEMILLSRNHPEPHLKTVFQATKAFIFMGTPHTGSWMAHWASVPAKALGILKSTNRSLLKVLETDDQLLESLQQRFLAMLRDLREADRRLEITCFYEELPLPVAGIVVSKESATFGGYNLISIHANHRNMVRFADAQETGFKRVLGELLRWETETCHTLSLGHSHTVSISSTSKDVVQGSHHVSVQAAQDDDSDSSSLSSGTGIDENVALPSASAPRSGTKLSQYRLDKASQLFKLGRGDRCRMAAEKCLEALGLRHKIDEIVFLKSSSPATTRERRHDLQSEVRQVYSSATARCLRSLSFSEMGARESIIEQPAQNTCEWIYKDPLYCLWSVEPNRLLWIKGKPGSGKSILMKSVCGRRKEAAKETSTLLLNFFFNARGATVEKSPVGLYVTMMNDLLRQSRLLMCEFLPTFLNKETCSESGKVNWHVSEIEAIFHSIISQKQSHVIEILIDALDECNEDEVRAVIRKFERSIDMARESGSTIRVCWSSRHYPNIGLLSAHGAELVLDQRNGLDIARYVDIELPARLDPVLPSIRKEVLSRANGVFLWAVLVGKRLLKAIDQGKDKEQLRQVLESIPVKLDDLFDEIFRQAESSKQDQEALICITQWIFCAFRPLALQELHTALYSQAAKSSWSYRDAAISLEACQRLRRRITDLSGGLFEVVGSPPHLARVQVIHESVREFFLGSKGLRLLLTPSREAFVELAHKELAVACFKALLTKDYDSASTTSQARALSEADVLDSLAAPWTAPENAFLELYVQDFAFDHFDRARSLFSNTNPGGSSPLHSAEIRRRVLLNFLRLCRAQATENMSLRPGFNAHMQKVSVDPSAFGVTIAELINIMAFVNNLSLASTFFSRRHIYMFTDANEPVAARPAQDLTQCIAVFCLIPKDFSLVEAASREVAHWRAYAEMGGSAGSPVLQGDAIRQLLFVFTMQFSIPKGVAAIKRLQRQISRPLDTFQLTTTEFPTNIRNYTLTSELDRIDRFNEMRTLLESLEKTRLHEHVDPIVFCLLFRLTKDCELDLDATKGALSAGVPANSSKAPKSEDVISTDKPNQRPAKSVFLNADIHFVPKGSWWRPREQGRDREMFERESESDSGESDQGDNDSDSEPSFSVWSEPVSVEA